MGEMGGADLVLTNAAVLTMDPERPRAEALAVKDGEIIFVGDAAEANGLGGAGTERIEKEPEAAPRRPALEEARALVRGVHPLRPPELGRMDQDAVGAGSRRNHGVQQLVVHEEIEVPVRRQRPVEQTIDEDEPLGRSFLVTAHEPSRRPLGPSDPHRD